MKTKIRRQWNTYAITCYGYQVGTDQRATGGVHLHCVRYTRTGWQKRISDSNGGYVSHGPTESVSEAEGESLFARVGLALSP